MTENELRQSIINIAKGWLGCKESDGSHKKIIDVYNSHKPLARNYTVKYTDSWCSTFASAVAIKAGLTDIIPTECGCEKHIELFKSIGSWQEDDAYVPKPGDYIFYDWDDSGIGNNTGWSDHVGIVTAVSNGVITVIEGNKNDSVAYRTIKINGQYIRGYGVPKYSSKATTVSVSTITNIKVPILKFGSNGNSVKALQSILTAFGYSTQGIDGDFGNNTLAALKKYQKDNSLTVDGSCGPLTWTKLIG